ncbi:MAG: aminotransferase class I/II-fold pyridoxal phosphate-dependent enzyme [Candidatus Omnitrophica bacterium]|nr:aminotransferase class I/II-fold pyridoxal phosphate-dependent enzyme [Candidatus Omnitrophota bacterium]
MTKNLITQLKELLAGAGKEKNTSKIHPDSKLLADLGIDSFSGIELIYNIEQAFGINIDEKMFHPAVSVVDLINYLDAQKPALNNEPSAKNQRAEFSDSLFVDKVVFEKLKFNPYYQPINSGLSKKIKINNKEMFNFGSNDYLGLSQNKTLKSAAIKAIKKYGLSMCATPIVLGSTDLNLSLEKKLASFLRQDAAIVYPSGYQANLGIFQAFAKETDIIIADKDIHSSLINSCLLSKAKLIFFAHNDMANLEKILKDSQNLRMRFIVIEGLYSTDGTIADLDKIIALGKTYKAGIIVDDSHGIGVLGKSGRGILEYYRGFNDIMLITGSLGKACGTFGGFIAGKNKIIEYLRYNSSQYLYSTALPAHIAAATTASLDLIRKSAKARRRIFNLKNTLYAALQNMNYKLTPSQAPLFSILFPDTYSTLRFSKLLFSNKIYAIPFVPPSVPHDSPRIRLSVSTYLNNNDIKKSVTIFKKIRNEYPR